MSNINTPSGTENLCERCNLPVPHPLRYHEWFVCVRETLAKIGELERSLRDASEARDQLSMALHVTKQTNDEQVAALRMQSESKK